MEKVKEGYKMTELGEIPEEWEVTELKNLVVHHNAGIYKKRELYGSGTNIVGVSNLYDNISVNGQIFNKVPLTDKELEEYTLQEGDLIYGDSSLVRSGIGRTLYVTKKGEGTAFAWHTRRFNVKQDIINSRFLNYILNNHFDIRKAIMAVSTQTALTGITTQDFFNINILIPKLEEQFKIGEIISVVDEQIEITDNLIEKTKELKKGLMQKLLTKGIGHGRFKDTEIGKIPVEWEVRELGGISEIKRGASPRPIKDPKWFSEDENIGWIRISDVTKTKKFLYKTEQYLSNEGVSKSRLVKKNDLIMSICATVGKPIILMMDACIHDGFVVFDNLNKHVVNTEFLFYVLSMKEEDFKGKGQTGTQSNLNTNIVGITKAAFPPLKEQQKIASILSSVDNQIEEYQSKKEKLGELKKGLMQKLLSGKVRVKI